MIEPKNDVTYNNMKLKSFYYSISFYP